MKSVAKKLCALAVLSASVVFCGTAHGAPILLKARTIEPEKEAAKPRLMATSAASPQAAALPERGLYIVQHDGVITPSWRESLEATGAIVRYYIPENAYLVEASPAAHEAIRNTIPHTYLGEFKGEYRYDASFVSTTVNVAQTVANGAEAIAATREFAILLFTEECREDVAKNITAIPGCSISSSSGKVIRAKLTTAAVKDISSWPDVSWMEPFVQARLHNDVAVESSRMNVQTVWPGGTSDLGLTGEGQIVGVADSGFDTGDEDTIHRDVRGRVITAMGGWYSRPDEWSDLNGHGTHVVGSVLGNGSESDGKIKGVAYNAKLVMQSLGYDSSDNVSYPSDIYELYLEAYGYGAKIHSNSYGGGNDNSYTLSANRTDAFLFDHLDAVILRSAGNDGEDLSPEDGVVDSGSISDFAVSKNAIVVGASEGFRTTGNYAVQSHVWEGYYGKYKFPRYPVDPIVRDHVAKPYMAATQGMAAFSSRGPCADGRVKPDIVAPGTGILSLY